MRPRISIIGHVRPLVGRSVGRLVGWLRIRSNREIRHNFDIKVHPHHRNTSHIFKRTTFKASNSCNLVKNCPIDMKFCTGLPHVDLKTSSKSQDDETI